MFDWFKKGKKTPIVNNYYHTNMEIDYDRLAEAIAKAQKVSKERTPQEKVGFWKAIGLIIINREPKAGQTASFMLASLLSWVFNALSIISVLLFVCLIGAMVTALNWSGDLAVIIIQAIVSILMLFLTAAIALIFRGIANDIKAEKDRNYIATLFFGFTSLASLIVALVALFKGVG